VASAAGRPVPLPELGKSRRTLSPWTSLGTMWKNRGLMSKRICILCACLHLSPFT
jgi:hypothetical protein